MRYNSIYYLLTPWSRVHAIQFCILLTYSMEQSPSWEANRFPVTQEIPRISWNSKLHYRIYKCPPPVTLLSQIKLVHALHTTSWRSILIFSSHLWLGLPSGLFPSGFPTKVLYRPLPSLTRATCPATCIKQKTSGTRRRVIWYNFTGASEDETCTLQGYRAIYSGISFIFRGRLAPSSETPSVPISKDHITLHCMTVYIWQQISSSPPWETQI